MNLKKIKQYAFIGLFVGGMSLAFPVFNVFSKQLSLDNHENRLLTTNCVLPLSFLESFTSTITWAS